MTNAEYQADKKNRQDHPEKYPWFAYFQYGWHNMTYMTDEEVEEAVKFYRLKSDCKGGWFRYGRQPITIMKRGE